jgi:diguanylate cyclase (GGDEF)-like protein/PAS domain S-box-containing protein
MIIEEEFNEEFNFYFRLLKELADGICITNKHLQVIYWNEAMEKNLSYKQSEIVGRFVLETLKPTDSRNGDKEIAPKEILSIAKNGSILDLICRHKEGHGVAMQMRVDFFSNTEQENGGYVFIFSDSLVKATIERAVKELEQIAYIDKLTDLPNRRYLENEFEKHFNSLKRYQIPFGMLLLDIDHFKKVNDTYGHDNGDRVLRSLGQTLMAATRKDDIKARWGGEEFVILTYLSEPDKLLSFGERLRKIVGNSRVVIPDTQEVIQFTISIGVTISKPNDDKDSILKRCDEMLYKSKLEGRNRVSGSF